MQPTFAPVGAGSVLCPSSHLTGLSVRRCESLSVAKQTQLATQAPDQILLTSRERRPADLRRAWLGWLAPVPWQWNVTLTFSCRRPGAEFVQRKLYWFVEYVNRAAFGRHWAKFGPGVQWIAALEFQRRGTPHFHMLLLSVGTLTTLNDLVGRFDAANAWQSAAGGFASVQAVKSAKFSIRYVVKHACKGGRIEVSSGLRYALPQN